MINSSIMPPLNNDTGLTEDEWFDVYRILRPGTTREEFTLIYDEFLKAKKAHYQQIKLH